MSERARQAHVMVINDTPDIPALFTTLPVGEGYRVTTGRFAAEAGALLERVKTVSPDLLILDFLIGGETMGRRFPQMLRTDCATRDIPMVECTAAVGIVSELQPRLDEMGVVVVLKSFDIDPPAGRDDRCVRRRDGGTEAELTAEPDGCVTTPPPRRPTDP